MAAYNKKTIEDVEVSGKTVLVRCDFNVPMKDGVITSDKRIVGALPTIKYLMEKGAKVILCSHMGKPHGIFTEGFGLSKKEKKAVEALPEAERAAATEEYLAKALKGDKKKFTLAPVAARLNELLGEEKVTFAEDLIVVNGDANNKFDAVSINGSVTYNLAEREYLAKCRAAASFAAKKCGWNIIDCSRDGEPRTIEDISAEIMSFVKSIL